MSISLTPAASRFAKHRRCAPPCRFLSAVGGTLTGPEDPLLQFGGQFILSGPLTDFEGFRDVGSFTWTLAGHTVGNAVHLDVEEIGLGCTLSFDGSIAP
ncbi:MAG TPA: hypothetical protein VFO94_14100 [Gammaproteobacteria bacterium]|nr:hypothetical protein [Gammaproteobacteria bacterium]